MKYMSKRMWDAYAKQAGGVTFDGKPLPTWDELGEERQLCWIAAAAEAADHNEALQDIITRIQYTNLRRDVNTKNRTIKIDRLCKGETK